MLNVIKNIYDYKNINERTKKYMSSNFRVIYL